MKTFSILTGIILAAFLIESTQAAVVVPTQDSARPEAAASGKLVKAVIQDGQLMPVVELPVVEIVSTRMGTYVLGGVIRKGNFIAFSNLPVIEITAAKMPGQKYPATVTGGEVLIQAGLPLIEISSVLPYNSLVASLEAESARYPVVQLPEITISGDVFQAYLVEGMFASGTVRPVVDLPVIDIRSEYMLLVQGNTEEPLAGSRNTEWFFISLKHCSMGIGNKIVCELISRIHRGAIRILPGMDTNG